MIKVLHKAFDLLESMAADKSRVFTLTELATMIHEKPTTCANIVKTLCERGYLSRVEPRGYMLGPVAQDLNYVELADTKLIEVTREPMTAIVQAFGASGILSVLRRGKKKILDDYKSESELVINKTVRGNHELYTTSTGLVLTCQGKTAFSKAEVELIQKTYGSIDAMLALRQKIKEEGYVAISLRPGILEVAAPVRKGEDICAAIAVYLPEFLVSEEKKQQLIQALREVASMIQERI